METFEREVSFRIKILSNTKFLQIGFMIVSRVGRYFDILIYRDILRCDYHIEGRNSGDDISKLSSRLTNIVILKYCLHVYIQGAFLNHLIPRK